MKPWDIKGGVGRSIVIQHRLLLASGLRSDTQAERRIRTTSRFRSSTLGTETFAALRHLYPISWDFFRRHELLDDFAHLKAIGPFFYIAGPVLLLAVIFYYPIHDLFGLWNTSYSSKFSRGRFEQVMVGMSRSAVVGLLGAPLDTSTLTNHPVWALRDEGVRTRYGKDSELQIETLSFSRSKRGGDYDMVSVWIGPDTNVIQHERWVTD